ncbi:hypothetical protein OG709_20800 [Streptomyces sp. NBC_01267]|uniref:hypothetical protein n=1 Tax=unclassified Streptomyces TaxID=2593676 RepID=UPI002E30155B|nr:hypothetical protein [Streptomyces sp. NBC_01267]WSV54658.1 hypothetical protein OG282_13610 [Streptomyces sp. NBC_01014]
MDRELYGRDALLHGLAPRLIGLPPEGYQQTPTEAFAGGRDDLPVAVLTGGRGMGKTVVLKQLRTNYRGRTPVALIDCEHPDFAAIPSSHPRAPFWSPVTEALSVLGEQLGPAVRGAGAVEFPRLAAGLMAIASTGWDPNNRQQVHDEALRLGMLVESGSRLKSLSRGWLVKITAKFAALWTGAPPGLDVIVETTVESLLEDLFDRGQRAAANWYGQYPGAGGQAKRGLNLMALQFHRERDSDARALAERHLVGALRADLRAAYQGMGRLRRVGRPLVLLDNVQAPLGRRLLEPVLRDRAAGRPDQVVFIAALRGYDHPALRSAERCALPQVTHTTPWTRGTEVASGALVVELTALGPEHVRQMLGREDPAMRTPPLLARSVHRLTGGRPLGVALLTKAAGQAVQLAGPTVPVAEGPEHLTPGSLLSRPVLLREDEPGRPTVTELLQQLVDPARLDRLAVLAAAHGTADAEQLAAARLDHDGGRAGVLPMRDLLTGEYWPVAPDHFIGDPFLRTLLLHRLRHPDGEASTTSERWREVQETMRDLCAETAPRRLHHELALGRTENAVTYLRDTFGVSSAADWLDELRFIASAPYFADHDDRRAVALGRTDAEQVTPDGIDRIFHLRIRRLLYCVWQLTDLLALPDEGLAEKMGDELGQLSGLHPTGNEVLWHASRNWPTAVREWRGLDRSASDLGGNAL